MKLQDQLKEYIQMTVYSYLNGCEDDNYEPLTEDDWVEYVLSNLEHDKDIMINGQEFKHLYFCGKDKIAAATRKFVQADEWAQQWTNKGGK